MYEAKSDQDIACELAEKLGIARADVYPFDVKQQYFNQLASMEVCDEDGKTYVPAVGITQEDIDELGVEGEPQEGKLAYQELKQLGVYQVKRTPDDNYGYIAFKDFVEDPELIRWKRPPVSWRYTARRLRTRSRPWVGTR